MIKLMMNSLRTCFVIILAICWQPVGVSAVDRPNILMIVVDDLRPMLGCYGDPRAQTPNIDRLAARGVVFERAYCQYAKCGPSRLSMMTGLRPDTIGVFDHRHDSVTQFRKQRSDVVSMARWLKDHGYHTRGLGKVYHDGWDVASDWSEPAFPGRDREMWEIFDQSNPTGPTIVAERFACPVMQNPDVPDNHFFAGRMTDEAIRTLHKQKLGKPLFLAVGYRRPHLPFVAPRRYYDLHQPDNSWLAQNQNPPHNSPVMAWFNSDGYVKAALRAKLTMPNPPNHDEGPLWNGYEMRSYLGAPNQGLIDSGMQLKLLHAYAACVSYVDAQIGRLLNELEKTNRLSNTIIVLFSDHGWHLGEQSAWSKMTNFEIATRVPLIIAAPGIKPDRTHNLAELVDLYPTLCELTGLTKPPHLEGKSLVSSLRQPTKNRKSVALSQHTRFREKYMGRALCTDRYRFVAWFEKKNGRIVERELYDHQIDPLETRNIAEDPDQIDRVKKLEEQLRRSFGL